MRARHAEIAGAGFAGLVAAAALCRRGWTVRVHERDSELRAYGAGLFLWGNGLAILETIGVLDEVERGAHAAPAWDVRVDGERRSRETTNGAEGVRTLTLTRQVLYAAVLRSAQQAGAEILTSSRVTAASPEGVLVLADGRSLRADLVLGADGVSSNVRDSLGIPKQRMFYRDGIIRVLTDRGERVGGEWDHIVDCWATRGERTLRILYVPCDARTLYFAMMAPSDDQQASAIPIDIALWSEFFPTLAPFLATVGERGRYDRYEATIPQSWSVGKAAIVGDAANAMPPTLGQGAGLAMMNAYTLAVALDECASIEEGLRLWETRERPMTDDTQRRSQEIAAMGKARVNMSVSDHDVHAARHVPTGTRGHGG